MAHTVVKILSADDGERRENPKWHLSITACGDPCTLCEGEYFGEGQSDCEFKLKQVEKGGITCPECLEAIRYYKSIKL